MESDNILEVFVVFRVIKRIAALLSRGALLEAAAEAAVKQAESATKTAKSYMVQIIITHRNWHFLSFRVESLRILTLLNLQRSSCIK